MAGSCMIYFFSENLSDDQSKNNELSEHMGESGGAYSILVGKPEGKRPLEILRREWNRNIKVDFQEIGWRYGLD
jgi:hypothetical protein